MRCVLLALVAWLAAVGQEIPAPPPIDDVIKKAQQAMAAKDKPGAKAAWQEAWTLAQTAAPEDPRRYTILKQLMSAEVSEKHYKEAEEYLQLALHWTEKTKGPEDQQYRDDLTLLAYLCKAQGDFERGITVLQRVMPMVVKAKGFESTEVADLLSRIADFEIARKEFGRAEGVLRTSLTMREKLMGPEHLTLVADLEKLGPVLNVVRKYDQAEPVLQKAITLRERAMSPEIDMVNTLDGLAYAQFGQEKYAEAEASYKRLLSIWVSAAGPVHPMAAATLDKLVMFYRKQEREEEARQAWKSAAAIRAYALGETLAREAGDRVAQNNFGEAEQLYRQAQGVLDPEDALHAELRGKVDKLLNEVRLAMRKSAPKSGTKAKAKKGA